MRRKVFVNLIVICLLTFPIYAIKAENDDVPLIFSISLLTPNLNEELVNLGLLIESQLPKIGIGVNYNDITGLSNIAPRTWKYLYIDFDYIPTYGEGGYDILLFVRNWGIDWDPTGVYDTGFWTPTMITNFYQYCNPAYDNLLIHYLSELNQTQHIEYGKQMQEVLYEDLPSIAIIYPRALYGFKENLVGIDAQLLNVGRDRYEYWDDPEDHIIKYAVPTKLEGNNSFIQESLYDKIWMQGIYGSLYQREQQTKLWIPQIATNISFSEDNRDITVTLNPNAKFSDGSLVLAEDVEYSYELHKTISVGSTSFAYYSHWLGPNSISSIGTNIVTFNLTDTNPYVYDFLSCGIIDKSAVQPIISMYGYDIFNEAPFTGNVTNVLVKSCGPFMLDTYNQTEGTIKLIPNPYYGDMVNCSSPLLEELHFVYVPGKDAALSELITGSVDIIDACYDPLLSDLEPAGIEGILVKTPQYIELALNMKHPVFGTGELTPPGTPEAAIYVRKAISYAIPRTLIVDQICEGLAVPASSPCPDLSPVHDEYLEPYTYDLELAREYMDFNWKTVTSPTPSNTNGTNTIGESWIIVVSLMSVIGLAIIQTSKKSKSG